MSRFGDIFFSELVSVLRRHLLSYWTALSRFQVQQPRGGCKSSALVQQRRLQGFQDLEGLATQL